jgi:hypothetical protein
MAFVREKWGYFYLVENRRRDGRVRQVVLAYLGRERTVEGAWWRAERQLEELSADIDREALQGLGPQEQAAYLAGGGAVVTAENLGLFRRMLRLDRLRARIEVYRRHAAGPRAPAPPPAPPAPGADGTRAARFEWTLEHHPGGRLAQRVAAEGKAWFATPGSRRADEAYRRQFWRDATATLDEYRGTDPAARARIEAALAAVVPRP